MTQVDVVRVAPLTDRWRTLAEQLAPDATPFELEYAGQVCQRLDLSMFTNPPQVVLIGRWDSRLGKIVHRPQVTVDGRLALAVRSNRVVGLEGPEFTGPRTEWTDSDGRRIWIDSWDCKDEGAYPRAARYLIHVAGYIRPVNGTAPWLEFCQRNKQGQLLDMWKRMPTTMLAKAALSLGLRRSGVENLPADIAVTYEGDTLETPALEELPAATVVHETGRHHTVGQQDGMLVCSCGHQEQTVWGMSVHRKEQVSDPAVTAAPSVRPERAEPSLPQTPAPAGSEPTPDHVIDDQPESRGYDSDLQPANYDDPGRPF